MEPLERDLIAAVRARPGDPEPRAVLEDYLLERGRPGARFVALDRELSAIGRGDPRFWDLCVELAEVASTLDPAWLVAVGEIDAARLDVAGERVVERGMRRVDALARAAELGPGFETRPNPPVASLARLRWALPRPHRWRIRQPPALAGQPGLSDRVELHLRDAGPRKIWTIKIIRAITGLGLREAKDLADRGGMIAEDLGRDEAMSWLDELRRGGATAAIASDVAPAGARADTLAGGEPIAVGLSATAETLTIHVSPALEPALVLPLAEVDPRVSEIIAAIHPR